MVSWHWEPAPPVWLGVREALGVVLGVGEGMTVGVTEGVGQAEGELEGAAPVEKVGVGVEVIVKG